MTMTMIWLWLRRWWRRWCFRNGLRSVTSWAKLKDCYTVYPSALRNTLASR